MQPILHMLAEPVIHGEHPLFRTPGTLIRQGVSHPPPVTRFPAHGPTPELPTHGRGRAAQRSRDRPHPFTRCTTAADLLPLLERQTGSADQGPTSTETLRHHPANVPERPRRDGDRHSH